MKPKGKYNLLLIHDDGVTRSFRLSRGAIRFLLLVIVLMPVLGGIGLWYGWESYERGLEWDEEERVLQQELITLRMQLDRLSNIEKLVQMHENGLVPDPAGTEAPEAAAAAEPEQPEAAEGEAEASEQVGEAQPETSRTEAYPVLDSDEVRLDAVSAVLGDSRRLRVRFDLYNESGRQIAGRIVFYVLTTDGERAQLAHNDPTFRISRMKKFAASSVIPEAAADLTNASLMIEVVNTDSELLCRQLYPIAD